MNMQLLAKQIIPVLNSADGASFRESALSAHSGAFIKSDARDGQWVIRLHYDELTKKVFIGGTHPRGKDGATYGQLAPNIKVSEKKTPHQIAVVMVAFIAEYDQWFAEAAAQRDMWDKINEDVAAAQARYMEIVPGSTVKAGSEQEMHMNGCRRWQVGPKNVDMDLRGIPHAVAEQILRLVQTVK
jgi:hypothetical protein